MSKLWGSAVQHGAVGKNSLEFVKRIDPILIRSFLHTHTHTHTHTNPKKQ